MINFDQIERGRKILLNSGLLTWEAEHQSREWHATHPTRPDYDPVATVVREILAAQSDASK